MLLWGSLLRLPSPGPPLLTLALPHPLELLWLPWLLLVADEAGGSLGWCHPLTNPSKLPRKEGTPLPAVPAVPAMAAVATVPLLAGGGVLDAPPASGPCVRLTEGRRRGGGGRWEVEGIALLKEASSSRSSVTTSELSGSPPCGVHGPPVPPWMAHALLVRVEQSPSPTSGCREGEGA